jgi:hypothetical protein
MENPEVDQCSRSTRYKDRCTADKNAEISDGLIATATPVVPVPAAVAAPVTANTSAKQPRKRLRDTDETTYEPGMSYGYGLTE